MMMQPGMDQEPIPTAGASGQNPFIAQAMALVMQQIANPDTTSNAPQYQLLHLLQKAMEFSGG